MVRMSLSVFLVSWAGQVERLPDHRPAIDYLFVTATIQLFIQHTGGARGGGGGGGGRWRSKLPFILHHDCCQIGSDRNGSDRTSVTAGMNSFAAKISHLVTVPSFFLSFFLMSF